MSARPTAEGLRLLLDMNLSPRLVPLLRDTFPHVDHVADVLPPDSSDADIAQFAADSGYTTIVTGDQDFDAIVWQNPTLRVVRIRGGRTSTRTVLQLLRFHLDAIIDLHESEEHLILVLP